MMRVTILKGGGGDTYYELGLLSGLTGRGLDLDFIGSDHMSNAEILKHKNVSFYNLRGGTSPESPIQQKIIRTLRYYFCLISYAIKSDAEIFHIQWLNKFVYFDRILLNLYYKALGKKLVFTAHNVDDRERDEKSGRINRLSLKLMYRIMNHIIVHTYKSKCQLVDDFSINAENITVIRYGINDMIPKSRITSREARDKLQLPRAKKIILFFGNIAPYKGLEDLVTSVALLSRKAADLLLVIAGRVKRSERYWNAILGLIRKSDLEGCIKEVIEFIPDEEVEIYFKAADVLVLPYKKIFQSGVLFLSYAFGLPVIAADVGSLAEDIVENETGFVYQPGNYQDLAEKLEMYFDSELFKNLGANRRKIIEYANEKYSWEKIAEETCGVYKKVLIG